MAGNTNPIPGTNAGVNRRSFTPGPVTGAGGIGGFKSTGSASTATNFGASYGAAASGTVSMGEHLMQNHNVVGAYGQWKTNPAPTQGFQGSNPNTQNNYSGVGIGASNLAQSMANRGAVTPQSGPSNNFAQNSYVNAQIQNYPNQVQYSQPQPNQNQYNQSQEQQYYNQNQPPYNGPNTQVYQPQHPIYQNNAGLPNNAYATNNRAPQKPARKNSGIMGTLFGPPTATRLGGGKKLDPNSKEYLQTLSQSQLRQEVIKTEVEIQKTLIETEKAYREGISTIKDLIAPSSVNIATAQIEIGTKLIRSFFVLTYPRVINSGWLEGVVNIDLPMDISIFVYPQNNDEVLRELKGKVGKIQASLSLNQERGSARDPALETAYRDVEGLRDAIQQGVERFFKVGVYFTIYADNKEEMEKNSQTVESILSQQSIIMKRSALQMEVGFNSSLPMLKDDLFVYNNMNTSPLSACFPFVSSDLSSNSGILYGINRQNSSLILFDRFELENANALVFATSGAGKSYTVKLEILRSMMMGTDVIVIDPENEYKFLSEAVGGSFLNVSLNSNNRINPFDLPRSLPGESNADILRSAIIDIMGLMNLMLGKLNPSEEGLMERAINECYARRDITPNSDFNNINVPTMGDLVEILNGIVGGDSLSQRLYRFTEGTFSGIFNRPTNINMSNQLVVFNIRDLQEALRPIAMYVLLKYVWNSIRSELKRRILAVDEAWIMMQNEDSARFLFGLAKRARKYYLGVTTITQDVGDFLNSPFGKPIVTNAAMKILLKQSTAAIDLIATTFALTDGEKQVLLQSGVGQGIFFAGPRHVAMEIVAFPTEHRIVTSNPKEIMKMQEVKKSEDADDQQEQST